MDYTNTLAELGVGGAHPGGLALTKEMLKNEDINSQTMILDAGCGTGLTSSYLYEQYQCRILACDIHAGMLKKSE